MDQDPDSELSHDETRPQLNHDHGVHSHPVSQEIATTCAATDHQESRWHRLKKAYQDQYLELLNETYNVLHEESIFDDTQYGSVLWLSSEKSSFFQALDKKGRHDLPAISQAIGTKSVAEVKDYLCMLQDAQADRQMFASYSKTISHADVDAAIEIGEDCEVDLEVAADALGAFQDNFDRLVAKQTDHDIWLVDSKTSQTIDSATDAEHETGEVVDHGTHPDEDDVLSFFHLSTFLDLSRKFFMNSSVPGQDWRDVAEAGQEPAMTIHVLEDFHDIVVSLVQRILQTAIFLAQSRQRLTATENYVPAATLKATDIETALNILNMSADSWDFWTAYPRRSGVEVVLDRKNLALREIEDALSVRGFRGRRRSLSSLISLPSSPVESEAHDLSVESSDSGSVQESDADSQHSLIEDHVSIREAEYTHQRSDEHEHKRRRLRSDSVQDEYLEGLDQATRMAEEARIRALMSEHNATTNCASPHTKHLFLSKRKTVDDLRDWAAISYKPSWHQQVKDSAGLSQHNLETQREAATDTNS